MPDTEGGGSDWADPVTHHQPARTPARDEWTADAHVIDFRVGWRMAELDWTGPDWTELNSGGWWWLFSRASEQGLVEAFVRLRLVSRPSPTGRARVPAIQWQARQSKAQRGREREIEIERERERALRKADITSSLPFNQYASLLQLWTSSPSERAWVGSEV